MACQSLVLAEETWIEIAFEDGWVHRFGSHLDDEREEETERLYVVDAAVIVNMSVVGCVDPVLAGE